ncbi:hypothetical protein [Streptomyces sp. NPDC051569]|uniref:hypothetical protein n=1 Tax=Streptomyces sp. NPDC051569 TaxID=3365661 RepID=UPI0037ABB4BD
MTTRYGGTTWVSDLDLVRRLGLRYMMFEITSDHPGPPSPEDERGLWLVEDGQATRHSSHAPEFVTAWRLNTYGGKLVTLRDFLTTYRHEVNTLRIEYLNGADVRR